VLAIVYSIALYRGQGEIRRALTFGMIITNLRLI
jgi:hypothetical protein